jgi:WD40 repeat protein
MTVRSAAFAAWATLFFSFFAAPPDSSLHLLWLSTAPCVLFADEFEDDDINEQSNPSPVKPTAPTGMRVAPPAPAPAPIASHGPLAAPLQQPMMQPPPAAQTAEPALPMPEFEQRRFIAPPSNQTRQLKEERSARLKALRGVLQLRDVDITLYDAAPLTPYELHTRHQSRNVRMKTTQTGDDSISIGLQTEEVETDETSVQWPEDGAAPGMSSSGATFSASDSAKTQSLLTANVGRLKRFLISAGQVIETLCTENLTAATGSTGGFNEANSLSFSQRHSRLGLPDAFGERTPTDLTFDATGSSLLAAFGAPAGPLPHEVDGSISVRKADAKALRKLAAGGLLAQWRLYRPESPSAVMRCVGVPSCCLLPEAKPHLVFAGTEEGSIQLWNTREPGSSHASVELGGATADRIALRSPTYSSDCLASGAHLSPITQLCAMPVAGDDGDLSIASLELEGLLILWVVLEAVELDALDLGQAVGGKERLLRSGSVALTEHALREPGASAGQRAGGAAARRSGGRSGATSMSVLPTRCVSMTFLPMDQSRLLISTDLPTLLHRSRYPDSQPSPEAFVADGVEAASASVCGVAFCPASALHCVAGRSDGSVALYHVDDPKPLLTWAGFASGAITQVAWSPSRPAVIWALDASETVHLIDLTQGINGMPFLSSHLHTDGSAASRAPPPPPPPPSADDDLGGDGRYSGAHCARFALDRRAMTASEKRGDAANQRLVAVTGRDAAGSLRGIEVHLLSDQAANPSTDEEAALSSFLRRL